MSEHMHIPTNPAQNKKSAKWRVRVFIVVRLMGTILSYPTVTPSSIRGYSIENGTPNLSVEESRPRMNPQKEDCRNVMQAGGEAWDTYTTVGHRGGAE